MWRKEPQEPPPALEQLKRNHYRQSPVYAVGNYNMVGASTAWLALQLREFAHQSVETTARAVSGACSK